MNTGSDACFPKRLRIRKRADYLWVQKTGQKIASRGFIGLVKKRQSGPARLGIITTKRYGNSPTRNRIRRLIKEAFRRGLMGLPERVDFVVIPQKRSLEFDSKTIFEDLGKLGQRARKAGATMKTDD